MQRDLDKMRRRPFFFPLVLPVLLFIALVAAAAWLFDARATTVVFVVRHAEVETPADADPDLSVDGRERAARLAKMLSQARPVRGINAIFASEYKRTQQTATPLSETAALPVNVVASAAWSELPRRILRDHRGEYVLVVGSCECGARSGRSAERREDHAARRRVRHDVRDLRAPDRQDQGGPDPLLMAVRQPASAQANPAGNPPTLSVLRSRKPMLQFAAFQRWGRSSAGRASRSQ